MFVHIALATIQAGLTAAAITQQADEIQTERRPEGHVLQGALDRRPAITPIAPKSSGDAQQGDGIAENLRDLTQGSLWPEGFLLTSRNGRLRRGDHGWEFVFSPNDDHDDKPIKLLPNSKLRQMEAFSSGGEKAVEFDVTGRVTEYANENHLLVETAAILSRPSVKAAPTPQPAHQEKNETGTGSILSKLQADSKILERLDQPKENSSGPQTRGNAAYRRSATRVTAASELLPEGTRLIHQVGRLIKELDDWTFAFESDSDEPAQPPLHILPNLSLQAMQQFSAGGARSPIFVVSGDITEYYGLNYFLILRFSVRREDGNIK